ncbi:MAG: hypothetical protein WC227_01300 [Patescibacteria group bacterium]|jgi:hypothetical protein
MSSHGISKPDNEKYLDDLRYFVEIVTKGSIPGQDPITREIDRIVPLGPRTLSPEVMHLLMDAGVIIDTGQKGAKSGEIRPYGLLAEKRSHRNGQLLLERASSLVPDINFATLWRVSSTVLRNLEYFLTREGSPLQRLACRPDPGRHPRLYYMNEFNEWSLNYDFVKDYIGDQQT